MRVEASNQFGRKTRELGLPGYVRALALEAPCIGREIPGSSYVSRWAGPVEE